MYVWLFVVHWGDKDSTNEQMTTTTTLGDITSASVGRSRNNSVTLSQTCACQPHEHDRCDHRYHDSESNTDRQTNRLTDWLEHLLKKLAVETCSLWLRAAIGQPEKLKSLMLLGISSQGLSVSGNCLKWPSRCSINWQLLVLM